jgi:hypothetical protein
VVDDEPDDDAVTLGAAPEESEGPVHRPLIRATLPRPEGQPPARPTPEFTIRQPNPRPGRFRPAGSARRGAGQHAAGQSHGFNGRRGPGPAPSGRPGQGNRVRPPHADRQGGHRRRGGKKRMK